jgi:hypothetical protein
MEGAAPPPAPPGAGAVPPAVVSEEEVPTAEEHLHLPVLSVWPISTAAGITVAGAGLVTIWPVTIIGIIITLASIAYWIQELRDERRHNLHGSH